MKLTRDKLRSIIKDILAEQFTIPKGMNHSQFEKYTESDDLDEIYASEIGDDSRAEMGGDDEDPDFGLYEEDSCK